MVSSIAYASSTDTMPGGLAAAYQREGRLLYAEGRSSDTVWDDGSSWTDGVSRLPPVLPIEASVQVQAAVTCALEEILLMDVFLRGEDLMTWHLEEGSTEIGRRWTCNLATALWVDTPEAWNAWSESHSGIGAGPRCTYHPTDGLAPSPVCGIFFRRPTRECGPLQVCGKNPRGTSSGWVDGWGLALPSVWQKISGGWVGRVFSPVCGKKFGAACRGPVAVCVVIISGGRVRRSAASGASGRAYGWARARPRGVYAAHPRAFRAGI